MKVRIFSCNHLAPIRGVSTPLFQTLISGVDPIPGTSVSTDTTGFNIGHLDKFCELRHQFYVWKNLLSDLDYVGFEHYRRLFYIDPFSADQVATHYPAIARARTQLVIKPEVRDYTVPDAGGLEQFLAMRESFRECELKRVCQWISDHDIIYTNPIFEQVDKHFKRCHTSSHDLWDTFSTQLSAAWPRTFSKSYLQWPASWSAYRNMYILSSELFSEYMELLLPLLLDLDRRNPDAPRRIWGHISERVFGAFVMQKRMERPMLKTNTLPFLLFPKEASVSLP